MRTISPDTARRIALRALGLGRPRPAAGIRRDVRHLRRVAHRLGVVQLDSVNVLARAHELPFWSRIGAHDRTARDAWLWRSRELFEGWIHVASCAPIDLWPMLHHRRAAIRPWPRVEALLAEDPGYLDAVHAEVAARGPTSVQELADAGRRTGPWWGVPKGKTALDYLFVAGRLAVHDRNHQFVTRYDLTERVIPAAAREAEVPPPDEAARMLVLRAARAQGIATAAELADHFRMRVATAKAAIDALVATGDLEPVRVRGWDAVHYRHPRAIPPRTVAARALLSPFDPLVWHRARTERLFGFRYRIEIYVPEPKRVYGYYVLPFLLGDRLVARVDLKAERATGRLLVRAAFAEEGVDRIAVARELAAELADFGAWLDVPEVVVASRGDLVPALARAVG